MTTLLVVFLGLPLLACREDGTPVPAVPDATAPEVAAAFDWIEAAGMEFGAAPYSPPGWPLQVGDRIDLEQAQKTLLRTPGHPGFWAAENRPSVVAASTWQQDLATVIVVEDANRLPGHGGAMRPKHWTYAGHFPVKVLPTWGTFGEGARSQSPVGAALDSPFAVLDSLDELRARWHEPFERRFGKDGAR